MTGDTEPYLNFDRVADCYESTRYIPPAVLKQTAERIAADCLIAPGGHFLDAGVGTGRFARHLASAGVSVVGVDVSSEMLARARAGISLPAAPQLARADLRALPFRDAVFDGALIVHVLHLVSDWKRVAREMRRVLKAGSPLYIGSETGKRFLSRGLYFQVAGEWQLMRPNTGAPSLDAILEYLAGLGAEVIQIDQRQLAWTAQARVGEMLDSLRTNPFSHMWHIPPDTHAKLIAEVERRARTAFPSHDYLDYVEEVAAGLSLWRVTWS